MDMATWGVGGLALKLRDVIGPGPSSILTFGVGEIPERVVPGSWRTFPEETRQ